MSSKAKPRGSGESSSRADVKLQAQTSNIRAIEEATARHMAAAERSARPGFMGLPLGKWAIILFSKAYGTRSPGARDRAAFKSAWRNASMFMKS